MVIQKKVREFSVGVVRLIRKDPVHRLRLLEIKADGAGKE